VGDLPGQPRARQALTARPIPVAATSSTGTHDRHPQAPAPHWVTPAPGGSCGWHSVCHVSPLWGRSRSSRRGWGGIKEANADGLSWQQIARLGIKAIVVEGQPTVTDACYLLRVTKDGAEILPADDLAGRGMYEAFRVLRARHGNGAIGATEYSNWSAVTRRRF